MPKFPQSVPQARLDGSVFLCRSDALQMGGHGVKIGRVHCILPAPGLTGRQSESREPFPTPVDEIDLAVLTHGPDHAWQRIEEPADINSHRPPKARFSRKILQYQSLDGYCLSVDCSSSAWSPAFRRAARGFLVSVDQRCKP